jgi:predicted permease
VPAAARDEVLTDLDEIWEEHLAGMGRAEADRWYWAQVVSAVLPAWLGRRRVDWEKGEGMMAALTRDVRFGFKQLRRHPGVGLVVVATLALGIGATTSIFSVVDGVLLEPLPYEEPSELVMVTSETGGSDLTRYVSGLDFHDMGSSVRAFETVAVITEATIGPMTDVDRPAHVLTTRTSWNLFDVLGIDVALGRSFNPDDALPAPQDAASPLPMSAVISHDLWQRMFGGDPDILGTTVRVWGSTTEIVGVLPEGLRVVLPPELNIPPNADFWRVMRWDFSGSSRAGRYYRTVARLADGVSVAGAQQEMEGFAEEMRAVHPTHAAEETEYRVTSLQRATAAEMSDTLWLLMGAVTLVLLIACANVANLLLARGAARADEMAVRASLGAGGGRLVRQLLTESAILAALGAVGGVMLARLGVAMLHAIRPTDLHRLESVAIDLRVLGFTLVAAVLCTLVAGFLPAWHTARIAPGTYLKTRGSTRSGGRSRAALVVAEVALSVVLLAGAGLLIRTFGELQRMPLGFEPDQVLTVTATQPSRTREERQAYEADLVRAATSVPGVVAAGIVFPLPMNGVYERSAEYAVDGRQVDPAGWTTVYYRTVSPTYFDAMGLELRRGRHFTEQDENYDVPVVILDERLARREYPGLDPLGRTFWVRGMEGDTLQAEIVGVVERAPQWDHRDQRPTMYFPRTFYQSHEVSVVAKVAGDPALVAPMLSESVRAADPAFPSDLVPMSQYVTDRLARSRFVLILMQIFGALALGLSAVGLYGVLSYSVRGRTKELGLRRALGAEGSALTESVVREGLRLAAVGIGLGLVGALGVGRALRAQLFEVSAADPWALAVTAAVVLTVAAAASLLPALRAASVDPVVALQEE